MIGYISLGAIATIGLAIFIERAVWKADRKCPICQAEFAHADIMYSHFEWRHPDVLRKYGHRDR